LELVRRGAGFLSDDFAVLSPNGRVKAFPRRTNLTQTTVELLGLHPGEGELRLAGFHGEHKWMMDIDSVFPGRLRDAAPLGHVLVLDPGTHLEAPPDRLRVNWRLELDRLPPSFLAQLAQVPGVVEVNAVSDAEPPNMVVTVLPHSNFVAQLDALCLREDVTVLAGVRGEESAPDFRGRAHAVPWAAEEALPVLLSHSLSLSGARFLQGTSPELVMSGIADLRHALGKADVTIHRLTPGTLQSTADLVETLVGPASP
jgi:hypothetical protein